MTPGGGVVGTVLRLEEAHQDHVPLAHASRRSSEPGGAPPAPGFSTAGAPAHGRPGATVPSSPRGAHPHDVPPPGRTARDRRDDAGGDRARCAGDRRAHGRPEIAAAVLDAMRGRSPRGLRGRGGYGPRLREPAAPHRPRADHLPALHRRPDDRAARHRAGRAHPRGRHRLRATRPRSSARSAPGSTRSRSWRRWRRPRRPGLRRWGMPRPPYAPATATPAGPSGPPSTASSSPAAAPAVPPALVAQLGPGGRLVIPGGPGRQDPEPAAHRQARRRAPPRCAVCCRWPSSR